MNRREYHGEWTSTKILNVYTHLDQALVAGAFSYIGSYLAERLLDGGIGVRTPYCYPRREDFFVRRVRVVPLDFSDSEDLRRSIDGAGVLYNTYWIRFARGLTTFEQAVETSRLLFDAAAQAGSREWSTFPWPPPLRIPGCPTTRAKGQVEILKEIGQPYDLQG